MDDLRLQENRWLFQRLSLEPHRYPLTICSSVLTKCIVLKADRSVSPKPVSSYNCFSLGGRGNDHSLGDIVIKRCGNPNCFTASHRKRCCHFQNSELKDFPSRDLAGEQCVFLAVVMAPDTVLKSHRS